MHSKRYSLPGLLPQNRCLLLHYNYHIIVGNKWLESCEQKRVSAKNDTQCQSSVVTAYTEYWPLSVQSHC